MSGKERIAKLFKSKKVKIFLLLTILCVASFFMWYFLFPKTVESRNGVKHQIGRFNEKCSCSRCNLIGAVPCQNQATHKIKYILFDSTYCDNCWNTHGGQEQFEYLCSLGKETDSKGNREMDAWLCAQKVVRNNLKAPTTAKFCSSSEAIISYLGSDKYSIEGTVTAQNSFGAELTSSFKVTLTLTEHGFKDATCIID